MDTTIIPFWKNKLFWTGLLGAVLLAVQQIFMEPEIDWKKMALAGVVAIAGYVSTTLRGQNTTFAILLANVIGTVVTVYAEGNYSMDWKILFGQLISIILGVISPDPKPVGYERTDVIRNAKIQGQIVTPNALVDGHIKKDAREAKEQAHGDINQAVEIAKTK
jgi:uncharacterized membrane protein